MHSVLQICYTAFHALWHMLYIYSRKIRKFLSKNCNFLNRKLCLVHFMPEQRVDCRNDLPPAHVNPGDAMGDHTRNLVIDCPKQPG